MSKVKPLLAGPVAAARRVLAECDVLHPRDIDVEVIASRCDAMIVYGPLTTATGILTRSSKKAVIWIDERFKGQPRADFTGAHEVGHHVQHTLVDHFAQCKGEEAAGESTAPSAAREADKRRRAIEREADHFSTELLMPEVWAAPLCDVARPTLDDVHRLSRRFRTSLHASARRFLELTRAPCAFVHTKDGRIKHSTETEAFPGTIVQRRALHPHSFAASLQDARAGTGGGEAEPKVVPGAAWGAADGGELLEFTIALGPEIGVMSWIVPAS